MLRIILLLCKVKILSYWMVDSSHPCSAFLIYDQNLEQGVIFVFISRYW